MRTFGQVHVARRALASGLSLWIMACAPERLTRVAGSASPPTTPMTPIPATPRTGVGLEVVRGDGQWLEEGTMLSSGPVLLLHDGERRPLVGQRIHFQVGDGGGELSDTIAITNAEGLAHAPQWRVGAAGRAQRLRARFDTASAVMRAFAFRPPVASDQERLLFARNQEILETAPESAKPRLVRRLPYFLSVVAMSPGDTLMALRDARGDSVCIGALTTDERQCVGVPDYGNFWWFAWSADGKRLVFHAQRKESCRGGNGVCYLATYATLALDRETMRITPLLAPVGRLEYPRWSPDGQQVAFTRDGALWLMRSDGSAARALPLPAGVAASDVRWSPNGRQLALAVTFREQCPFLCNTGIGVMNMDGTGFSMLVEARTPDETYVSQPVWSPDGARVAFALEFVDNNGLYASEVFVTPVAGGPLHRLLSSARLLSWR